METQEGSHLLALKIPKVQLKLNKSMITHILEHLKLKLRSLGPKKMIRHQDSDQEISQKRKIKRVKNKKKIRFMNSIKLSFKIKLNGLGMTWSCLPRKHLKKEKSSQKRRFLRKKLKKKYHKRSINQLRRKSKLLI